MLGVREGTLTAVRPGVNPEVIYSCLTRARGSPRRCSLPGADPAAGSGDGAQAGALPLLPFFLGSARPQGDGDAECTVCHL